MRWNFSSFITIIISLFLFSCESKSKQNCDNRINSKSIFSEYSKLFYKEDTVCKPQLKVLTWNLHDLGKSKSAQELLEISRIMKYYYIVAIQEVVAIDIKGAQAVAKIAGNLNRMGSKWDYRISNPTNSPSSNSSERYAYIWETSKLSLLSKPYLDAELDSVCVREPFIGQFRSNKGNDTIYFINVHSQVSREFPKYKITYFKDYPSRLQSENIIILGDFNLDEKHNVWKSLDSIGFSPSIRNAPTSLKIKCNKGKYLNHALDNIYFKTPHIEVINSGRIDFVNNCNNLNDARFISDHLPVFMELNIGMSVSQPGN